ncbi:hypothetical protein [Halobellus rufus]|uniref:hypothetical protein n=1 Tax=Halobellus rufus TaxID=1448860 RepID=UPI001E5E4367|nr:hypothetical protein [Halobellus rufus]
MPSTSTTRRRLVATGGALVTAALGGCSQPFTGRSETGSRQLALSLSPLDGPLRERYVVDLTKTRPSWDEEAFNATLNGSTYTTQYHTPFFARGDDDPTYARRNGTYYHLDSHVVDERTVTHPVLRLYEVGRADDLETIPDHVSHSSLPEADQHAVQIAHFAARARGNVGGVPSGLVERDGYVYRNDDAVSASELLADAGPSHVEFRDTIYEVAVARETFHEAVYEADVDPVADADAEIETILRAELLDARVPREELPAEEREILREAMGESYRESHPYSSAFDSLLKRFGHWTYLDGNVEKDSGVESGFHRRFLMYGDRYFTYTLRFVDETTAE